MKLLIVLVLVVAAVARPNEEHYDSKYDEFNVKELTENERLLKSYAHCFIGDGNCTAEGKDIKKWIPEASQTSCAKCTEKQKVIVATAIKAIQEKLPAEFKALLAKIDPDNKYAADLEKFLKKYAN